LRRFSSNSLYKAESKFENEPNIFFKAVSLDHQRVSPIVESLLVFSSSFVCSQISIQNKFTFFYLLYTNKISQNFSTFEILLWHLTTVCSITFFAQSPIRIRNELTLSFFFDNSILNALMSLMSLITYRI
jgi:hypothetical protein